MRSVVYQKFFSRLLHQDNCGGELAQLARASGWQPEGHRFEPGILHHKFLLLSHVFHTKSLDAAFGNTRGIHSLSKLFVKKIPLRHCVCAIIVAEQ